jgi:hypothetical protein
MLAGPGLSCTAGAQDSCGVDTTVVPLRVAVPPTSNSACVTNQYAISSAYLYQCVAPNTWVRTALTSW